MKLQRIQNTIFKQIAFREFCNTCSKMQYRNVFKRLVFGLYLINVHLILRGSTSKNIGETELQETASGTGGK